MKLHDIAFIFFCTLALAVILFFLALNTANAGIADEAARTGVLFGCGYDERQPASETALAEHCGSVTARVASKPRHVMQWDGNRITFDFSEMQDLAAIASRNGTELRGHAPLFTNLPDWWNSGPSDDEKRRATLAVFGALCRAVPEMDSLDVVTDVDLDGAGAFGALFGADHLRLFYEEARRGCPGVELVLNFFHSPSPERVQQYRQQIDFDTLGIECHGCSNAPDYDMRTRVTEFTGGPAQAKAAACMAAQRGWDFTAWDPEVEVFDESGDLTATGQALVEGFQCIGGQSTPSQPSSRRRGRRSMQPVLPSGEQCFSFFGIPFCL